MAAEDRPVAGVAHLDRHRVTGPEERRNRRACQQGLHGALLGEAGVADAALLDRQARTAVRTAIGNRAEPMIVPADSVRVFAAWAIRAPKSKVMSTPRRGVRTGAR